MWYPRSTCPDAPCRRLLWLCRSLFLLTVVLALSACDSVRLRREIKDIHQSADQQIDARISDATEQRSAVSIHKRNWIGNTTVAFSEPVPEVLLKEIDIVTVEPQSLEEIAARIVSKTGIPVRLEPDILHSPETESAAGAVGVADTGFKPLPTITYRHSGSIRDFLDDISARLGIVWQYTDAQIRFSRFMSRIFVLHMLPGTSSFDVTVGGQAQTRDVSLGTIGSTDSTQQSTGSGDTGSEPGEVKQSTDVSSRMDRWNDLVQAVSGLLSTHGKLNASPSTGTLIVTDSPGVLERVEMFVNHQNVQLTRQIKLGVHVFSVTEDSNAEDGFSWKLLYRDGGFGANLFTPQLLGNKAALSLGIIDTDSDFKDSESVIRALNSLSNVSTITSANLVTLNNQPAPVQVTRTIGYLRSVSNVVTGSSGVSETTLEPGKITAGFVMTVTPRVLEEDRILIRFAADLSALLRFQLQQSDGASIQTPETDERAFLQEVVIRSGQSLVLSGFEQILGDSIDQGIGNSRNWLMGTGKQRKGKTRILIVISPQLAGDYHGAG